MNFDSLFYPQSIAIIGASSKNKTVGNDVVKNLVNQGYQGKILPVNPKISELYGQKVYHDIDEVDANIDLAIVAIPAAYVPENLAKAAGKGVKAAAVISAGFKEVGNIELEKDLQKVCQEKNITLVGPNCLGVINPEIKMNASFAHVLPEFGKIAFISQSGALCTAVLDYSQKLQLGFSKFLSIGNKADVNELKLVKYLLADDKTQVIMIYSEDLQNAPGFIELLQTHNKGAQAKPIIILKSGRTEAGASAIASHTGSLAGGDTAYQALFRQAGMIRANSIDELFNYAMVFARNPLTQVKNAAIITNAGGPGVLTTDELTSNGLELSKITQDSQKILAESLPPAASVKNPVDVLGDARADRYQIALEKLSADKDVDAIELVLTPQSMTEVQETAQAVIANREQSTKPMVVSFMGGEAVKPGVDLLNKAKIATSVFPEPGAKALAMLGKFTDWSNQKKQTPMQFNDVDKTKVENIFQKAKQEGKTSFPEAEAIEIMQAYNFPLLYSEVATSAQEAKKIAQQIDGSIAMKIVSQDILHKSDVGGVLLDVTKDEVTEKYEQVMHTVAKNKPQAKLEGVLLMEMAPQDGVEVVLGVNKAPGLGTMIMVGLGGIYVELLKDVIFSYAPVSKQEAQNMILGLQTSELFKGFRGDQAKDIDAIVECIGRLSQLITDFPEITELDINPLLALNQGQGAKVLDARVVIE